MECEIRCLNGGLTAIMAQEHPSIRPMLYRIEIAPDFARSDFTGRVNIHLYSEKRVREVDLNGVDLAIRRCALIKGEGPISCPFKIHPTDEMLTVSLPEPMDAEIELQIDYYGEINRSMAGFYRSEYAVDGERHPIAVTQFQESDARRAIPCMDHPMYKGNYEVTLIIDPEMTGISNMPVRDQKTLKNGRKRLTFKQSPKMSSYLLFFGVGNFHCRTGADDERARIAYLPGKDDASAYGLQVGEKALAYCEAYFGIPYPLPKLDLIGVPDFAFGAMENWGAITFRENLLLYDPEITSGEAQERICEVISHEIVHQWFGNLVTPSDWKYLWLNESFATYFGFSVVAHYHPDWQIWDVFLASETAPALARDGLTDTSAIEIPGGSHIVINSSTAPIIYSKGGSVLRQIEGYLGPGVFQSGLNYYLNHHAYDCTTSQDMWLCLEKVSGRPISRMMLAWVSTPGHPLVTANRCDDRLILHQKRFTYLDSDSDAVWPIPLLIRIFDAQGNSRVITEMMDTPEMAIDIDPDAAAYKVNDQQTGFYRVVYDDPVNFDALCRLIRRKKLSRIDRWGIENDAYSMVKARQYKVDQYLRLLDEYAAEDSPLVLSALFDHLFELFLLLNPPVRNKISDKARNWLNETINRMGILPEGDEPHGIHRLRSQVLRLAAFLDVQEIVAAGSKQFKRLISGEKLHPDLRRPIMQIGACAEGEAAYEWLRREMAASASSEQEKINLLTAMGCFKDTEQIEKALDYILTHTPDRNKFVPVAQMAVNPYAIPLMWDWYTQNCRYLKKIHPLIHERIIGAIVPICGLYPTASVEAFFDSHFKETETTAPVIRMALEKLEINRRLRNAY